MARYALTQLASTLLLSCLSSAILAHVGHGYLGGGVAASLSRPHNTSPNIYYTVPTDGGGSLAVQDEYYIPHSVTTSALFSLQGGYEFIDYNPIWPAVSLGLGIYGTPTAFTYSGQLQESINGTPANAELNFKYDASTVRLMAETKLTWLLNNVCSPFVTVGLGQAWTYLNGYRETAILAGTAPSLPPFRANDNTHFAWQVGLGLSMAFNFDGYANNGFKQERISVGYQYADLGDTRFDRRDNQTYPYRLDTGKLSTNDVYLAYTHFF